MPTKYRIKRINVIGLFEMFNHSIDFNLENHITIVYGENGIGKTMIFKIIDALFKEDFYTLSSIPFTSLEVTFKPSGFIKIKKVENDFNIEYKPSKGKKNSFDINSIFSKSQDENSRRRLMRHKLKRELEFLNIDMVEHDKFYERRSGVVLSLEDAKELYPRLAKYLSLTESDTPEPFSDLLKSLNIYLIQTQRLYLFPETSNHNHDIWESYEEKKKNNKYETAVEYSKEVSELIRNKHNEYRKLSEKLELSLGKRLLQKQVKTNFTNEQLKEEAETVELRRSELMKVGLLAEQEEDDFLLEEQLDEISKAIIAVNIQDIKNKLAIFDSDNLYQKLKLFLEILNTKRLSFKQISISEEKGFVFKNAKGKELSANQLSSGEQHELVLLYQLLFKVPENSLILIDEPEISLHISWQKEFLNDLEDIIKLRDFDIVLSTHSPSIINGNWDFTVSLSGELENA